MKAQTTGSGFSIGLHVLLLAIFWSFSSQIQTVAPPLLLDLNILQGLEEQSQSEPAPGPPTVAAAPAPEPEVREAHPEPVLQPIVPVELKPVARKKSVAKKIVPQEQPKDPQVRQEPASTAPLIQKAVHRPGTTQAAAATSAGIQGNTTAGSPDPRGGVYSPGEIDGSLTALKRTQPAYPASARRRNIEGWVQVQFVVNEHGRPEQIRVLAAKPKDTFDRSVLESVSRWRFRPGTVNGAAVRVLVEQTIRFQLN